MQIVENKALLLRLRNPERVLATIPKAQVVAQHPQGAEVLVHWGLDEARVLRNLGVKRVPSPIEGRYKWPGMFKPFTHQRITASFLTLNKRAFCFNEPGTGEDSQLRLGC
jgi:hypothetical protein